MQLCPFSAYSTQVRSYNCYVCSISSHGSQLTLSKSQSPYDGHKALPDLPHNHPDPMPCFSAHSQSLGCTPGPLHWPYLCLDHSYPQMIPCLIFLLHLPFYSDGTFSLRPSLAPSPRFHSSQHSLSPVCLVCSTSHLPSLNLLYSLCHLICVYLSCLLP